MSNHPKVSVLMAVFNAEKYVDEAIKSILQQSYTDFEFIIVDDGSTDSSLDLIKSFTDKRIKLITNSTNLGLAISLNHALNVSKGEFLARFDADDISDITRLSKQVRFMDENRDVGVCGTWVEILDGNKIWSAPTSDSEIKTELLFFNPMFHPTVMMRRSIFINNFLFYDSKFNTAQDYDLWSRASFHCQFANLPEPLVKYRIHNQQACTVRSIEQTNNSFLITQELLKKIGFDCSDIAFHKDCYFSQVSEDFQIESMNNHFNELIKANRKNNFVERRFFESHLAQKWWLTCSRLSHRGLSVWHDFYASPLTNVFRLSLLSHFKFFIRCCLKYKVGIL